MPPDLPPEPWLSLLREIDRRANTAVDLVCIGGFVMTIAYGAPRMTADLDVLWTARDPAAAATLIVAERGGDLHRRYGVSIDRVSVATRRATSSGACAKYLRAALFGFGFLYQTRTTLPS